MNSHDPDGILLIDKPPGCTSHDLVDFIRSRFKIKKAGHCGTLDPQATGLIILTIGRGTKIQDLLMSEDKTYTGTLTLGIETDTQDAQGKIIAQKPVPPLSHEQISAAFAKYQGEFYQTPPMVSAIKKGGVPLYKLARQGKTIEREPRLVYVTRHTIDHIQLPHITFTVECSKGFYVRTYCHDIGNDLGCGGHLSALRRSRSGNFDVANASTLEELRSLNTLTDLIPRIIPLADASRMRRV
jgi:tRNA pseudouridine55 synthase